MLTGFFYEVTLDIGVMVAAELKKKDAKPKRPSIKSLFGKLEPLVLSMLFVLWIPLAF